MFHKIRSIKPIQNNILEVTFVCGAVKNYDYRVLNRSEFDDLENIPGLFPQVKVDVGGYGISWNDNLDIAAEELWYNGK